MARRLSADLNGLVTDLESVTSKALGVAALDAKRTLATVALRAGGGDGRLSGRRNARLGVRYDYVKGGRGLTVVVRATGPWQLVEYGRSGGYRNPRRNGFGPNRDPGRRGRPRMRVGGDAWATGPFTGGRAAGRRWWGRSAPEVMAGMGDSMADAVVRTLERW